MGETKPGSHARIASYDGIRGIGIIGVMGAHANLRVFYAAGVALDVFFALSGYLITTLLLKERKKTGSVSLRRFYARRALRLVPALVLVVAAVTVYSLVMAPPQVRHDNLRAIPPVLLYFSNWARARLIPIGFYEHTWTLSVEEQFYIAWPLVLVLLCRRRIAVRRLLVACAIGVVAPFVLRALIWDGPSASAMIINGIHTRADSILWGCTVGVLLFVTRTDERHARWAKWASWVGVTWLLLAFGVNAVVRLPPSFDGFSHVFGLALSGAGGAALVAHLTLNPDTFVARVLSIRPVSAIGRASYGLYLWHYPIFVAVDTHLGSHGYYERLLVKAVLAATAGTLTYRYVEKPFLRRKRDLAVTSLDKSDIAPTTEHLAPRTA